MKKELQEKVMENFDEANIENVSKLIEKPIEKTIGIVLDESSTGADVRVTQKSREICANLLLN